MNKGKILLFFLIHSQWTLALSYSCSTRMILFSFGDFQYLLWFRCVVGFFFFWFTTLRERVGWTDERARARAWQRKISALTTKENRSHQLMKNGRQTHIQKKKFQNLHTANDIKTKYLTIFFEIHMGNPCSKYKRNVVFCGLTTNFFFFFIRIVVVVVSVQKWLSKLSRSDKKTVFDI